MNFAIDTSIFIYYTRLIETWFLNKWKLIKQSGSIL